MAGRRAPTRAPSSGAPASRTARGFAYRTSRSPSTGESSTAATGSASSSSRPDTASGRGPMVMAVTIVSDSAPRPPDVRNQQLEVQRITRRALEAGVLVEGACERVQRVNEHDADTDPL